MEELLYKAGSTLSALCDTFAEHTLLKLEIKNDPRTIFI